MQIATASRTRWKPLVGVRDSGRLGRNRWVKTLRDGELIHAQPAPERENIATALRQTANTLETFLRILLGFIAVAIVAGAVFLMLKMDGGSRSLGGRFYVAIAALVILGAVDSRVRKLIARARAIQLRNDGGGKPLCSDQPSPAVGLGRGSFRRGLAPPLIRNANVFQRRLFRYRSIFVVFVLLLEHSKLASPG